MKSDLMCVAMSVMALASVGAMSGCGEGGEEAREDREEVVRSEGAIEAMAAPWVEDRFDGLALGSLNGQGGWAVESGAGAAAVVAAPGGGREVAVDAVGTTIAMRKAVAAQTQGRHRIEVAIRAAAGTVNASVAKLDVQAAAGVTLFQIYAGASIRVNYDQAGASVMAVPSVTPGATYVVSCEVNLATGRLDVAVNGAAVGSATVTQANRQITQLGLWGWDLPGAISFDNLVGQRVDVPPTITVTGIPQGPPISGVVTAHAETSASTERVELYVDGWLVATDTQRPFDLAWDTRVNPLPAATHPLDLGYYFVEWKNPATFAARRAETNGYTNTYLAGLSTYVSDNPAQWIPLLSQSLANAAAEGRKIHLNLEMHNAAYHPYLNAIIAAAKPYWNRVSRIELADEPVWSLQQTNDAIALVDSLLIQNSVPRPPGGYGITYLYTQPLPTAIIAAATGLSWVGIEAYLDPPGSPTGIDNFRALTAFLSRSLSEVPPGKSVILIPMAYDRNGAWPNIDTLLDVQPVPYGFAYVDPRIVALHWFAYTRPGGSFDRSDLRTVHRLIAEKVFGITIPRAGNGRRIVYAKAIDGTGANAIARLSVIVAN